MDVNKLSILRWGDELDYPGEHNPITRPPFIRRGQWSESAVGEVGTEARVGSDER